MVRAVLKHLFALVRGNLARVVNIVLRYPEAQGAHLCRVNAEEILRLVHLDFLLLVNMNVLRVWLAAVSVVLGDGNGVLTFRCELIFASGKLAQIQINFEQQHIGQLGGLCLIQEARGQLRYLNRFRIEEVQFIRVIWVVDDRLDVNEVLLKVLCDSVIVHSKKSVLIYLLLVSVNLVRDPVLEQQQIATLLHKVRGALDIDVCQTLDLGDEDY